MTPSELGKELNKNKFQPVYYFYGSEDYRMKEAEKAIATRFLPKSLLKTNHTILSAKKQKLGDILSELSIFPMLGENQLFSITDIQNLKPKDIEKILKLMTPPDPNRIIIMSTPSAKLPRKNSKVLNLLNKKSSAVEFGRITGNMSAGKIKAMLDEKKIEIDFDALQMLVTLGGGNIGGLIREVDKLIDYIGDAGVIYKEDILAVCSDYQVFKIYELADQVAIRNLDRALDIVNSLLRKGETPAGLTFWLSEHFIDLYLVKNNKPLPIYKRKMSW
ncbi:MAG: DNA polymerase III subunit delta, partial [candidate division Zixibacteria bacterium]|nr:DNA polymerase III subunit delta [candidate division Zixibacteria bacterium]